MADEESQQLQFDWEAPDSVPDYPTQPDQNLNLSRPYQGNVRNLFLRVSQGCNFVSSGNT